MTRSRQRRVVVGVDGSSESLAALRQAVAQARCRRTELRVVHARLPAKIVYPPGIHAYDSYASARANLAVVQQQAVLQANIHEESGRELIAESFRHALGGMPSDVTVSMVVVMGKPAQALLDQAWSNDDLLVLGTRGGQRWHHLRRGSVSRYCARHAGCPVLIVPSGEDGYNAAVAELRRDILQFENPPAAHHSGLSRLPSPGKLPGPSGPGGVTAAVRRRYGPILGRWSG